MFRVVLTDSSGSVVGSISDINKVNDVQHRVTYNEELGYYVRTMPTSFTFVGEIYQYLFERFRDSYCGVLNVKVYKQTDIERQIFNGTMYISDCVFDIDKCSVSVEFTNNDWQSKIDNNFDIAVSLKAEQTKNSTTSAIIPLVRPTEIELCDFTFWIGAEPTPRVHSLAVGFDLKDVFTHIVSYISDNTINFASDWYDGLQPSEKIIVTNGVLYRTGSGSYPIITLRDLYTHIRKLFNVVIVFDVEGNDITMHVEHISFLQSGTQLNLTGVKNIELSINNNLLYSNVLVGSSSSMQNNSDILPAYQFPKLNGYSFANENFAIQTECNTQNQLDLSIEWVIDHNILQKSTLTNEENDENIFLINYNSDTNCPVASDPLGFSDLYYADYYYNQIFTNNNTLSRYNIYGTLVIHEQTSGDTFLANASIGGTNQEIYNYLNTTPTNGVHNEQSWKMRYRNDYSTTTLQNGATSLGFDTNNNFGVSTSQGLPVSQTNSLYTCPQSGFYKFEAKTLINIELAHFNMFRVEVALIRRNSGGTEITREKAIYAGRIFDSALGNIPQGAHAFGIDQTLGATWAFFVNNATETNLNVNITRPLWYYTYFNWTDSLTKSMYMDAGDTMEIEVYCVEYARTPGTSDGTSIITTDRPPSTAFSTWESFGSGTLFTVKPMYFACTDTVNGGSAIIQSASQNVNIYDMRFNHWLNEDQIMDVLNSSCVNVYVDNDNIFGFGIVRELTINHIDNMCTFVVSSNKINAK